MTVSSKASVLCSVVGWAVIKLSLRWSEAREYAIIGAHHVLPAGTCIFHVVSAIIAVFHIRSRSD